MTRLIKSLLFGALLAFGAQAQALLITPSTSGVIPANLGSANCEPTCVESVFGQAVGSLTLLYKGDLGSADSGTFANSYDTSFLNSPTDPSAAVIRYVGGPSISCPSCFMAIKDGNHAPSYYFYNLMNWNGTDSIELKDFWPAQGAISHVSIWGTGGSVPEPGMLALMGIALAGLGFMRRRAS